MVDSSSSGAPTKAPRWDLAHTEGCGGGNIFCGAPGCFRGTWIYIGKGGRSGEPRGAHETRGAPSRGARPPPSWPPRLFLDFHSKSSRSRLFQKDRSRRFHSVWTPFDIPFLRNTEIGKNKQQYGPWFSRLVPKII